MASPFLPPWHHRYVTSSGLEHLARTAYEAHRGAHPADLPPWEETTEQEQQAWRAAVSAVATQTGATLIEKALPARSLVVQAGDKRHIFQADFTAGRQGNLAISDDFASGHHCRFRVVHGLWLVEDLGSTNGTWLNGRRFNAAQRLKKGDKIKIGQTVITIVST
jgi:pSer/pThr/pTyr-binding forkhead associated (FHA) protein